MKTTERNPMIFTRVEPKDRQEAQEVADRLYDGNLSLLVRLAVKQFVRIAKSDLPKHEEEAVA